MVSFYLQILLVHPKNFVQRQNGDKVITAANLQYATKIVDIIIIFQYIKMQDQKPKSIRQIRKLKKKQSKINETWKKTIIIRGNKTSQQVLGFLKDIRSLRKEKTVMYGRKHQIYPYESADQIQKYCKATDASLFLFGSHNKKRPNDIIFGRTYQNKVLDMVELGLRKYQGIASIADSSAPVNIHPFVIFQGDIWETDQGFKKLRNLFNDFFFMNQKVKGIELDKIMSVLVCFTVLQDKRIVMRTYKVDMTGPDILQEDGKMTMQELGPHAEFVLRRTQFADTDTWKKATYVPKPKKKKQDKNVKYDAVGNKRGKIYVDRQNLGNIPLKRKLIAKAQKKPKQQILKQRVENQFAN